MKKDKCSSIRAGDSNKLNKLIKNAGSVLGTGLESLEMTDTDKWT